VSTDQARAGQPAPFLQTLLANRTRLTGIGLVVVAVLLLLLPPLINIKEGWSWTLVGLGGLFALPFAVAGVTFLLPPELLRMELLVGKRREVGYVFIGIGVALLAVPVLGVAWHGFRGAWPYIVWGLLLAALFVVGGVLQLQPPVGWRMPEVDALRLLFMTVGAVAGFLTALLGLVLPLTYKAYSDVLKKGVAEWRANPGVLAKVAVPLFGGLLLMFLALQLARSFERTQAGLRRLLYGYKAVLDGLLLLAVLALANLLPYTGVKPFSSLNKATDWTKNRMYTLHPTSQEVLGHLDQPVKVYALLNLDDDEEGGMLTRDVENLLENFRSSSDMFDYELISPDRERKRYADLDRKYKLPERYGLLVVYGTGESAPSDFIRRSELQTSGGRMEGEGQRRFVGEEVLIKDIVFLAGNKQKKKIYFTSGAGELSMMPEQGGGPETTIRELRSRLAAANYEVADLSFGPGKANKVPDDADLVVIARPHRPLSSEALAALGKYMEDGVVRGNATVPGRLFVLLDVYVQDGRMVSSGLEGLLNHYGVKPGDRHLLMLHNGNFDPNMVVVIAAPVTQGPEGQPAPNPIGRRFTTRAGTEVFRMTDVRMVDAASQPDRKVKPVPLLGTIGRTWLEDNLNASPEEVRDRLLLEEQDGKHELADRKQLSDDPRPVGVMVTETGSSPGRVHGTETPRLVVVGSASWVTDQWVRARGHTELFTACAAWLMQRPDIPPQSKGNEPATYTPDVPKEPKERESIWMRAIGMPGLLAVLVVIALGGGVWLVRRR